MSETTETICHWEQVQRQWMWEWASYHPHPRVFWTAGSEAGTTELVEGATLAPEPPELTGGQLLRQQVGEGLWYRDEHRRRGGRPARGRVTRR